MSILSRVTPTNLQEEKEKFLADETYNPQFKYDEKVGEDILFRYGKSDAKTYDLAQTILDKAYLHKTETDLEAELGPIVSQQEVEQKFKQFLEMHQLQNRFELVWSSSFIARTVITSKKIKIRLPVTYRKEALVSVLYHEIGTHALRRVNYEQQPWFKRKEKLGFSNYLQTEEGLASLHSRLPLTNKLAHRPALSYVAATYAQKHSFAELWNFLKKYIDEPNVRWNKVVRMKRGLTDTSQPGGFTKDLLYFAGMVEVWNYLNKNNFDLKNIYIGKVALADIDQAVKMNPRFEPKLPSFYLVNPERYAEQMAEIGKINLLK